MWYSVLLQLQCVFAYFCVTLPNNAVLMALSCIPFLSVIASYNYQMLTCKRAPKGNENEVENSISIGSRLGLVVAWISVPLINFLSTLSTNVISSSFRAELISACIVGVGLVISFIWKMHPYNCWKSIKFRENFIGGWCIGNCLSGSFMFGLFLWLKLNVLVNWSYFTVFMPVWIINAYLIALSITVFIIPSIFRLSDYERKSCILGLC